MGRKADDVKVERRTGSEVGVRFGSCSGTLVQVGTPLNNECVRERNKSLAFSARSAALRQSVTLCAPNEPQRR